jgi:D-3-phosphoglycerate dehydrogenase / 2-oxoglutarate reductase
MIIKGALSYHLSDVNYVNASFLAQQRGVNITEQKTSQTRGFTNLITVEITTDQEQRKVSGTLLNGFGPRIVKVDEYPIDVVPEGHLLLIQHQDQPGVIGRVGTLLGTRNVNIASMQVGRKQIGGQAIMMLTVDKPVSPDILAQLAQLDDIRSVREIDL